jgi:shikimate dehydrogenase
VDRYVIIGNPVAHSLSPDIHTRFAAQMGESLEYTRLLVPLGEFDAHARRFFDSGGRGASVTLPFKEDAFRFAASAAERARLAGAANFLMRRGDSVEADNVDGLGLANDLVRNLKLDLHGKRVLILGAGGAVRGIVAPLHELAPTEIVIANRTAARAAELAARFAQRGAVRLAPRDAIPEGEFALVINATSTSTHGQALALPPWLLAPGVFAYDLAYGAAARAFVERARAHGAHACDGLGMLVEQAAEQYFLWRGHRPETAAVLTALRARFA